MTRLYNGCNYVTCPGHLRKFLVIYVSDAAVTEMILSSSYYYTRSHSPGVKTAVSAPRTKTMLIEIHAALYVHPGIHGIERQQFLKPVTCNFRVSMLSVSSNRRVLKKNMAAAVSKTRHFFCKPPCPPESISGHSALRTLPSCLSLSLAQQQETWQQ